MRDLHLYKENYFFLLLRIISSLYILLSVVGDAGRSDGCIVVERHLSPYVTASYERYPPLSGCFSRETTPKNNEKIHAILLTRRAQDFTDVSAHVVNIFLKPSTQDAYDGSNLVFLLFSTEPVTWRIHPPRRLANSFIGKFWISNSSHIERSGGDRIRMKLRRQRRIHADDDPNELIDWMRQKWGAVTSFLQLEMANLITVETGIDSTASDRCSFHMVLPNNRASLLELRDTKGCTSSHVDQLQLSDKDVHIVELLRASHSWQSIAGGKWDDVTEVVVNVRPRARRPVLTKHLVLVLKSHVPVTWTITTQSLRGVLDVITDNLVNSSLVSTHTLRIAAETLTPYTGQSLVQWTSDKYGQPLSYTVAPLANHFDIIVDGAGAQVPPTSSSNQDLPDDPPKTVNKEREDTSLETNEKSSPVPVIEPKSHERDSVSSTNVPAAEDALKMVVIPATRIYCSSEDGSSVEGESDSGFMQISIAKDLLKSKELVGLRESDVTLKDGRCGARDNGTHYLLSTRFDQCDTSVLNAVESADGDQDVIYQNAIIIRYSTATAGAASMVNKNPLGATTSSNQLWINVRCDLRGELKTRPDKLQNDNVHSVGSTSSTVDAAQFQLRLYSDSGYREEITAYPRVIFVGQHLFVKAQVISKESNLRVVVTDCSLESDTEQKSATVIQPRSLISRRCAIDKSVTWIDDLVTSAEVNNGGSTTARGERFRIEMSRCETCATLVQLRCQLLLCSNDPAVQKLMKVSECPLREHSCSVRPVALQQSYNLSIAANISRGPLMIQSTPSEWPVLKTPVTNLTSKSVEGNSPSTSSRKTGETSGQKVLEESEGVKKPAPLTLEDEEEENEEKCEQQVVHVVGLDSVAVVCIAFASFFIGVALVAAIWFIYVRTARRVVKGKGGINVVGGVVAGAISGGRISADSSGESTPCSTAPMTVKHNVQT